jgi:orotate phosphoribosyltransferase
MPTSTHEQQLLTLLARLSFRLGQFTLSSGATSDYYIDCRSTTLHAEGGRLTGHAILDLLDANRVGAEAVGGLTLGADPIVSNVATASAWRALLAPAFQEWKKSGCPKSLAFGDLGNHELAASLFLRLGCDSAADGQTQPATPNPPLLHGFLVRKSEKAHGTGRRIEGFCREGARVVIVDDVCTTGASTIAAIQAAQQAGMIVAAVICIVEREEAHGRYAVEAAASGAPFLRLFTASQVRAEHLRQHSPSQS